MAAKLTIMLASNVGSPRIQVASRGTALNTQRNHDREACRPESGGYCQYRPAYALRATAGTRDSGPSAADQALAQHHNPDGSHDRRVTATAYVVPIPPTNYPPVTVYFEVIDPDDLSPYDGKLHPTNSTNRLPNDNRDPLRRMWWDEAGNPAGYSEFQQSPYLSFRSRSATHVPINGIERYAAETKLLPTGRYAGDNYQVRATLREPDYENEGGRFDTHTGMNTNNDPYTFHESTIARTTPLVAWKRVYIEQDNMYTMGATIVSNVPVWTRVLHVDNVEDFGVGNNVTLFWKSGGTINQYTNRTIQLIEPESRKNWLNHNVSQAIPPYAGIKPQGHTATYTLTGEYLPQAFGSCPEGSDGGAFIEFRHAPTGSDTNGVPKYHYLPEPVNTNHYPEAGPNRLDEYALMWHDNRASFANMHYLLAADKSDPPLFGWHFIRRNAVFCGATPTVPERENTVVHEIGHSLGLRPPHPQWNTCAGPHFLHIDEHSPQMPNWAATDLCIMNYTHAARTNVAKFCTFCLLEGSGGTNYLNEVSLDSLRTGEDI